jgi:hypothetical protein
MSFLKMVRKHNLRSLENGVKKFVTIPFEGPEGVYYDPVGDDIFVVYKHFGGGYEIVFRKEILIGNIMGDHGLNEYLGKL